LRDKSRGVFGVSGEFLIEESYLCTMRDFTWSPAEKAARAAFDLALAREVKATREKAEIFCAARQMIV
jgi:hypothetical protein